MEVVSDMKLTDMAIIFQLFFICLITVLHVKSEKLYADTFVNIMYDNVMDGIVEDSLRAGYKTIDADGKPVVILDDVLQCFFAEVNLYDVWAEYIVIYVDVDGFYVWNSRISNEWGEKIEFSRTNETEHPQKVHEIIEYIKKEWGMVLSVAYNDGESYENTGS